MNAMIRTAAAVGLLGLSATAAASAPLSLEAAIARAVEQTPVAMAADSGVAVAAASARQADAALKPQLALSASQSRVTSNLAAQGLSFPGIDPLVGPFSHFDARLQLSQVIFDWSRVQQARSAQARVDVARAQARQAREDAAARAALAYINVLGSEQALAAAQANVHLSGELRQLALDQRSAGVASGIDVARAETALSQDRFRLSEADAQLEQARLVLARTLDLPPEAVRRLDGQLQFAAVPLPTAEAALDAARRHRPDLALVEAQIAQLDQALGAARSERLPKLTAFADYGYSGNTPVQNEARTYRYGASVSMPIFTGGTLGAAEDAARSRLQQARWQAADLNAQVQQDVRSALVSLKAGIEQVEAAQATRGLSERELTLARDRFEQGVANNIEVIQAQTAVAAARAGYVQALASFQNARVNLAAAQGQAQTFRIAERP